MEIPGSVESTQTEMPVGNWIDGFREFKKEVVDALPGSPFEHGLKEYVNGLWAQFISEEYPTPISEVPIPDELAQWAEDTGSYLKGLGPRLVLPIAYYLIQSFVLKGYLIDEFKLGSNVDLNTAMIGLVSAHAANLSLEYMTFKFGGVPVNALSPILRRIIDKMPDKEGILHNKPLMATAVILNHSILSELVASSSVVVGSELYKSLIVANALLLLGEGSINTVLLGKALARVLGENITDHRETLKSFDNMQFGL